MNEKQYVIELQKRFETDRMVENELETVCHLVSETESYYSIEKDVS